MTIPPVCLKTHPITFLMRTEKIGKLCNDCSENLTNEVSYFCRSCDYNLCFECTKKKFGVKVLSEEKPKNDCNNLYGLLGSYHHDSKTNIEYNQAPIKIENNSRK